MKSKWHWPEYGIEAVGLGLFMLSASGFALLLFHPESRLSQSVSDGLPRRALMGLAMALTALVLIHHPWGRRSGAHFNPAVTVTFWGLGRVATHDAMAYVSAQILGGTSGMALARILFAPGIAHPSIHYVVTSPGRWGAGVAWLAEFAIALLLMSLVLSFSSRPAVARFTGLIAALCVFLFITIESPVSGMSLNPARTLASALVAGDGRALWVYLTAPFCGMFAAASAWAVVSGRRGLGCAKLDHRAHERCIFCEFAASLAPRAKGGGLWRRVGTRSDSGAHPWRRRLRQPAGPRLPPGQVS